MDESAPRQREPGNHVLTEEIEAPQESLFCSPPLLPWWPLVTAPSLCAHGGTQGYSFRTALSSLPLRHGSRASAGRRAADIQLPLPRGTDKHVACSIETGRGEASEGPPSSLQLKCLTGLWFQPGHPRSLKVTNGERTGPGIQPREPGAYPFHHAAPLRS